MLVPIGSIYRKVEIAVQLLRYIWLEYQGHIWVGRVDVMAEL